MILLYKTNSRSLKKRKKKEGWKKEKEEKRRGEDIRLKKAGFREDTNNNKPDSPIVLPDTIRHRLL
jgi:hypothetical protein